MNIANDDRQSLALQNELEFMAVFAGTPEAAPEVWGIISPEDFYSPAMGNCYRHLMNLHEQNGGFIPEDMLAYVRENGSEEALNAVKTAILSVVTCNVQGAVSRAWKIKQYSIWRQALKAAQDISFTTPETIGEALETSLQALSGLAMDNAVETMRPIQDMLVDFVNQKHSNCTENIIPTGFSRLDGIVSLSKGDLAVVAARPAVGKSAFVGNLAVRFSMSGYTTALFSLEMSEPQILNRIMSSVGRIPHNFLAKNSIEGKYDNELGEAVSRVFGKSRLYIDDRSCQTVRDIKRKAIKAKADVVIIDYLQLMRSSRKYESKVNEVAEITRDLKIMAGDLNAVVILLSQLNRDVEKRAVPRHVLSDLRDSGSIEQDANSIIFLSKTDPNNANSDILAEVAKNRSGAVGQVVFAFDRDIQTFAETDKKYTSKGGAPVGRVY
ncbi:MAG: hypothetical protein OSJ54_11755 [Oscillospiraceae bacterium]|nr:hypothetical protein [Oscillospiraceae bacterium]